MVWTEQPTVSETTTVFDDYIGVGASTPVLDVSAYTTVSIWAAIPNGYGALQVKYTDPGNTSGNSDGPWIGLYSGWDPTTNLFTLPIITPGLVLTNNGTGQMKVSIGASLLSTTEFKQYGEESGVRQLKATVAANTNATLRTTSGDSLTRFNGRCQVSCQISAIAGPGSLLAYYVDASGKIVAVPVPLPGSSAVTTVDFSHPSVPVLWVYSANAYAQSVILTVSQ